VRIMKLLRETIQFSGGGKGAFSLHDVNHHVPTPRLSRPIHLRYILCIDEASSQPCLVCVLHDSPVHIYGTACGEELMRARLCRFDAASSQNLNI